MVGIGPSKDTIVPVVNNYLKPPSDLVARAHAHKLQVLLIAMISLENGIISLTILTIFLKLIENKKMVIDALLNILIEFET